LDHEPDQLLRVFRLVQHGVDIRANDIAQAGEDAHEICSSISSVFVTLLWQEMCQNPEREEIKLYQKVSGLRAHSYYGENYYILV
jgi:hypothetical protein